MANQRGKGFHMQAMPSALLLVVRCGVWCGVVCGVK